MLRFENLPDDTDFVMVSSEPSSIYTKHSAHVVTKNHYEKKDDGSVGGWWAGPSVKVPEPHQLVIAIETS